MHVNITEKKITLKFSNYEKYVPAYVSDTCVCVCVYLCMSEYCSVALGKFLNRQGWSPVLAFSLQ